MRTWRSFLGIICVLPVLVARAGAEVTPAAAPTPCGPSFGLVSSPLHPPGGGLAGVAPISPTDVWAVGTHVEHWDGSGWTGVTSVKPNYLWAAAASATDDVWGVGSNEDGSSTYVVHWDGKSLNQVQAPNPANINVLRDVAVVSADDAWAVGDRAQTGDIGSPLIERWNGSIWTVVPSPDTGNRSGLGGVAVVSATDVWAVGSAQSATKPITLHWDGSVWSLVPTPGEGWLAGVAAISEDDVWAVGGNVGGALFEHWDGSAWRVVPGAADDLGLAEIAAVNEHDVWAVSPQVFDATVEHWDGTAWTKVDQPADGSVRMDGLGTLPDGEIWLVGSDTGLLASEHLCAVQVLDTGFLPAAAPVPRGSTVFWTFPESDSTSHSVTDSSGMGLFDSGLRPPSSSFSFTFVGAGSYPFVDEGTKHNGSIQVPITARPKAGEVSTNFRIAWAVAAPSAGFVFDVQVKRPGSHSFEDWLTGQTQKYDFFLPDTGVGTYSFRARMRNTSNGASSGWSPLASILVS